MKKKIDIISYFGRVQTTYIYKKNRNNKKMAAEKFSCKTPWYAEEK